MSGNLDFFGARWTDDELQQVKDGFKAGLKDHEIAELLMDKRPGLNSDSVRKQRQNMGLNYYVTWSERETKALKKMIREGLSPEEITNQMGNIRQGITWHTISNRIRLLKLKSSGRTNIVDLPRKVAENTGTVEITFKTRNETRWLVVDRHTAERLLSGLISFGGR